MLVVLCVVLEIHSKKQVTIRPPAQGKDSFVSLCLKKGNGLSGHSPNGVKLGKAKALVAAIAQHRLNEVGIVGIHLQSSRFEDILAGNIARP